MLAKTWRRLFLAAFGPSLVVVAVILRSVLTTINKDVMLCILANVFVARPMGILMGIYAT